MTSVGCGRGESMCTKYMVLSSVRLVETSPRTTKVLSRVIPGDRVRRKLGDSNEEERRPALASASTSRVGAQQLSAKQTKTDVRGAYKILSMCIEGSGVEDDASLCDQSQTGR